MIVKVEVKSEKILQFFDLLNALRDEWIENFEPEIKDDDFSKEEKSNDNEARDTKN